MEGEMSRKDFILIADTIKALDLDAGARKHVAEEFARQLARTNARFDYGRFVAASLPKSEVNV
jgi:hypothetical protein